jgi:hypothetical protein
MKISCQKNKYHDISDILREYYKKGKICDMKFLSTDLRGFVNRVKCSFSWGNILIEWMAENARLVA